MAQCENERLNSERNLNVETRRRRVKNWSLKINNERLNRRTTNHKLQTVMHNRIKDI